MVIAMLDVVKHIPFLKYLAAKYGVQPEDDAYSEALLEMVKRAPDYDPEKGKPSTFLYPIITRAFLVTFKKEDARGLRPWSQEKPPSTVFMNNLRIPIDSEITEVNWNRINRLFRIACLTPYQKRVVTLWLKGETFREIGARVSATRQAAQNAFHKALEKLREVPNVKEILDA